MTPAGAARIGPTPVAADHPPGEALEPGEPPVPAAGETRLAPAASLASLHLTRRRGAPPAPAKAGDLSLARSGSVATVEQPAQAEPPAVPARAEGPADAGAAPAAAEAPTLDPARPDAADPVGPASPATEDRPAADPAPALAPMAAPVPAPAQAAPAAAPARAAVRLPPDIFGYWTKLRQGRRFPAWDDVDREEVAQRWPNSFVLACDGGDGSPARIGRAARVGGDEAAGRQHALPLSEPVIEWILATGRDVARYGEAIRDEEVFDSPRGRAGYRIVAVPLSDDQRRIDHILCHVSRA
jgi:hypothetical protein